MKQAQPHRVRGRQTDRHDRCSFRRKALNLQYVERAPIDRQAIAADTREEHLLWMFENSGIFSLSESGNLRRKRRARYLSFSPCRMVDCMSRRNLRQEIVSERATASQAVGLTGGPVFSELAGT